MTSNTIAASTPDELERLEVDYRMKGYKVLKKENGAVSLKKESWGRWWMHAIILIVAMWIYLDLPWWYYPSVVWGLPTIAWFLVPNGVYLLISHDRHDIDIRVADPAG